MKKQSLAAATLDTFCAKSTPGTAARRFKLEARTLHRYRTGERQPPAALKARFESELGIPVASWDVAAPPGLPSAAPPAASPPPVAEEDAGVSLTTEDELVALSKAIAKQIATAQRDKDVSPAALGALFSQARSTFLALARVRGELEVSDEMLIKSPSWNRMIGIVLEAATPFPEACLAIAEALEAARGGAS